MTRTRVAVLAVVTLVLAAAVTTGIWAANRGSYHGPGSMMGGRAAPGMMGRGGGGMMGASYGLAGDGRRVETLDAARARAQAFADQLGLRVGEVMQFSNGFYAELNTVDGQGATEVLIDPTDGSVGIEYGPAMMWNTSYGMHAVAPGWATTRVTAEQARTIAQQWLDQSMPGLSAGEPEVFPGYVTVHTLRNGAVVGMMSVNSASGAVWYHTWHGRYIASSEG
jgi:hypothetical protein